MNSIAPLGLLAFLATNSPDPNPAGGEIPEPCMDGHALVATGRVEVMLDPIMNPWDCGPFPPILREAGGYFGDWSGNETIYADEAISTTRALLPEVLRLVDDR